MKNKFGKRFIRLRDLRDYAVDLDLCPHPPTDSLMEYLEKHGLLTPVRRIDLPPEILRRFALEKYQDWSVPAPVEPDGARLDHAANLMKALNNNVWASPEIFGETVHVLDALAPEHRPFIQTEFPSESFKPWKDRRVHIYDGEVGPIYSNIEHDAPTFYHYWQIFWLAAILRSGVHIYYPLDDDGLTNEILRGPIPIQALQERSYINVDLEARGELRELREYQQHFEAVGYFQAYTHNAYQRYAMKHDQRGRISRRDWQQYLRREREIARNTLSASGLDEADMISFIGQQCEWWDNARRVGPAAVAEEYKRNINSSIGFVRAATGIDPRRIVEAVGRRTGHFKPTLEVIFPDWTEEQRDLTIRSLKGWADDALTALPTPFPVTETELNEFCNWLEERGLFQYYWHFRRLVDLQRRDDPVHRAASTAEVVGFATLCEMIANEVMIDRRLTPRGTTLFPKLRKLFDANGPIDLNPLFNRFGELVNTKSQSLSRRLAQIARITRSGPYSPILRAVLSTMAIRNEGAHLGLRHFDHVKVIDMIRILAITSLMIWKAR